MNKYTKILNGSGGTYPRGLEAFVGMDLASEVSSVSARRMAYCLNMWRDYESDSGGAIETVPGWRRILADDGVKGRVNGLFGYRGSNGIEYVMAHIGTKLYKFPRGVIDNGNKLSQYRINTDVNNAPSAFFESGGKCYFLDGKGYYCYDGSSFYPVTNKAYVPTTYVNGKLYEQRNMLSRYFKHRNTVVADDRIKAPYEVWEYELTVDKDGKYLKLSGVSGNATVSELEYAYIPEKAYFEGVEYPIRGFNQGFFDALTDTVQLVVDAPLRFYGASGAKGNGAVSGMVSLQRLVLRNPRAVYEFNACDVLYSEGGSVYARPNAPLRELWIAGSSFGGFGLDNTHEYSDGSVGITSSNEYGVTLYVESTNEMWGGGSPTKTSTVQGVVFDEVKTGRCWVREGITEGKCISGGGATVEISVAEKSVTVEFDAVTAYSHVVLELGDRIYCVLIRDELTGATAEENGKWYEYVVYDPFESVSSATVMGESRRFIGNADAGKVAVLLYPRDMGGEVEFSFKGYYNRFSTLENLRTVYDEGLSDSVSSAEVINGCTVVCSYDGRVFFTGNPKLPNTVFYSGRSLTGQNDPSYIGIYNYFNDGIGNVPNVAMVSSASMLAVLKGGISTDACAYYHQGQYNSDKNTADILPRIYPSTEGVVGIPCVGAACNFADDIVFLSPEGLEAVGKQTLNLERTLTHRSGRVDPVLRRGVSASSRMAEWKGYLCLLNSDGTLLLADSRAINQNEATGEAQYEWFMLDGVGSYVGDSEKWSFSDGYIELLDGEGNAVSLRLDELSLEAPEELGGGELSVLIGDGEVGDAVVYAFGKAICGDEEYTLPEGGQIYAIYREGVFCPVETCGERVGGDFKPATALLEFRGQLFFGTESGDICVFNTDKRGVSEAYGNGATDVEDVEPDRIHSRWYDRCGHRYESGFATLSDDCGYPQFSKSTVGKTLTLKAKRMRNSSFCIAVRSPQTEWQEVERFTVSENSFYQLDFANFSFEDSERSVFSSSEKLKKWSEKQYYLFSDGFRQPFGVYGLSYCYSFAGRVR